MPRIRYGPQGFGGRTTPRSSRPIPTRFAPRRVPQADLSEYNAARKAGYQPLTKAQQRAGYTKRFGEQLEREMEISRLGTYGHDNAGMPYTQPRDIPLARYTGQTRAEYKPPAPKRVDEYGRPLNDVDPALLQRVMSSEPNDLSGAFEKHDMYQGEEFIDYLYNEGIVPHFGNVQSPSGRWVDYLLTKMGITSYGVNPFAAPYPEQEQRASYGGGGYGGGGGGAAYTPPEPKQYGSTRNDSGYNPADWLKQMLVWNI